MTCREFKHSAASLTLWELSRAHLEDEQILGHGDACQACGAWLRKQRSLAASMRTLQTQTAGLEAGPNVEHALLKAFRQAQVASPVNRRSEALPPEATRGFPPIAMRLSRFFEIGAYAAVAAAIAVGVFLGVQLLQQRSKTTTSPVQSASAPASTGTIAPNAIAAESSATNSATSLVARTSATGTAPRSAEGWRNRPQPVHPAASRKIAAAAEPVVAEASQTSVDDGYVALMFCDPLSCSGDSQVVRMELPPPAGQDTQPQIADVVVGYDGVVRAVRIVN